MNYFYVRFHKRAGKVKGKVHPIVLKAQRGSKL